MNVSKLALINKHAGITAVYSVKGLHNRNKTLGLLKKQRHSRSENTQELELRRI